MAKTSTQDSSTESTTSHASSKINSPCNRAAEVNDMLIDVQSLLIPFIAKADSPDSASTGGTGSKQTLLETHSPQELTELLDFQLPTEGKGKHGLLDIVDRILRYSVNTWDRGYMHKLAGSTNAVGVVSELILAVLNTNLHVYRVSPVLTIIEKTTSRSLASLFGLKGPHAGGFTVPGGSAANTTALVVARNEMFPETRAEGHGNRRFVLFVGAHGHYSVDKSAETCGIGSSNVWVVPVDSQGRMRVSQLENSILKARADGCIPFFVCATAGTTVMGSFDPFAKIAEVCKREHLWLHIDAVYGGAVAFSAKYRHKLHGSEFADSMVLNPHKMMGVPTTCSFLLASDLRTCWRSNTLPAGYLFHDIPGEENAGIEPTESDGDYHESRSSDEYWDLADLTLQCGRRGDSLKLALGWLYYGSSGYGAQIDNAFAVAAHFASLVVANGDLELLGENPPPCLQVCFYFARGGQADKDEVKNTRITKEISRRLVDRGFMVDYAPGDRGMFFRAAVHLETTYATVETLASILVEIGCSIT